MKSKEEKFSLKANTQKTYYHVIVSKMKDKMSASLVMTRRVPVYYYYHHYYIIFQQIIITSI